MAFTESQRSEGASGGCLVQPLCSKQGHLEWWLRAVPGFGFEYLRVETPQLPWETCPSVQPPSVSQALPGTSLFALQHELCKCCCGFSWDRVLWWHRGPPSLCLDSWYPLHPHLLSAKSGLCILGLFGARNGQHWILLQYISYASAIVIHVCDTCMTFYLFLSSYRDFMWHTQTSVAFGWFYSTSPCAFNVSVS